VAVLIALIAALDATLGPAEVRRPLAVGSVVTSVLVGCLGVWQLRRGFSARMVPHAAGLAVTGCALNSVAHVVLSADPLQTTFLMLTLVGGGAVLPLTGWLLAVDVVCLAGFAVAAQGRLESPLWFHFALTLVFTVAVAHVLHALRCRGQAQLQQLTDALAEQARVDALTGLRNRLGLATATEALLDPAVRPAQGLALGVVCIDVDGFKTVNDELGHAAGDAVLAEVAAHLTAVVRAQDVVVRLGGDEFVVLLPEVGAEELAVTAHRLRIRLTGTAGPLAVPWSVSVGTASGAAVSSADVEQLMRSADLAMYDDKQLRRARRTISLPASRTPGSAPGAGPATAAG
jgi:diguanylate cyclase (GGDEF)-like protein